MNGNDAQQDATGPDYLALFAELVEDFAQLDIRVSVLNALRRMAEAMEAEAANAYLLDGGLEDPQARLICRACVGPEDITGLALTLDDPLVGVTVRENRPRIVQDPSLLPRLQGRREAVRSVLCAPLSVKGERLGAVEIINRRGGEEVFTERDCDALSALAAAALALVNARLTQAQVEQARTRRELELAAAVQRSLLPQPSAGRGRVHAVNLPARGVSGDFYDVLALPGGRIAFALADVSGKGMNAALVAVKAATLFRSHAKEMRKPGKLLARIGAELRETMSQGMFVTMVVGLYDPRSQRLRFSNAGHEPPLWQDRQGSFHTYPAEEPPLGIVAPTGGQYPEVELRLDGGSFYLYSDGCTEALEGEGRRVGAAGLQLLISRYTCLPAEERVAAIARELAPEGTALKDDVTLLVVEGRRPRVGRAVLLRQTVAADASQLKVIRRLVADAAQRAGMAPPCVEELMLAVDEACQNIIRHGYRGGQGRIELCVRRGAQRLTVELIDHAPPVDASDWHGRPLDELRPGGLGTYLIGALTDRVRYLQPPPGASNRLALTKRLRPLPSPNTEPV